MKVVMKNYIKKAFYVNSINDENLINLIIFLQEFSSVAIISKYKDKPAFEVILPGKEKIYIPENHVIILNHNFNYNTVESIVLHNDHFEKLYEQI